jgi:hypothetical protein
VESQRFFKPTFSPWAGNATVYGPNGGRETSLGLIFVVGAARAAGLFVIFGYLEWINLRKIKLASPRFGVW